MPQSNPNNRWYPSAHQIDEARNPGGLERSIRQILKQHYDLQDEFKAYKDAHPPQQQAAASKNPFPPGSGPTDTYLLGLPVKPIDSTTLTNGATLKWNKSTGSFVVS